MAKAEFCRKILSLGDPPVLLDLQALLDQCYRNGRYDDIDYAEPPIPAFAEEEAVWAEALLKAAGMR